MVFTATLLGKLSFTSAFNHLADGFYPEVLMSEGFRALNPGLYTKKMTPYLLNQPLMTALMWAREMYNLLDGLP